jgi:hypothetical protein
MDEEMQGITLYSVMENKSGETKLAIVFRRGHIILREVLSYQEVSLLKNALQVFLTEKENERRKKQDNHKCIN